MTLLLGSRRCSFILTMGVAAVAAFMPESFVTVRSIYLERGAKNP